jgi:glucuronate isomerase
MARDFLGEDFLLANETARRLYFDYALGMPIIDYHCHLPVAEIADNRRFENLTRIWLSGDHYKWRAMRTFGIEERLISGDADDYEKFAAWARVVPYTVRNPLYHWTHMELKDPFGVKNKLLGPDSAREIYDRCSGLLQEEGFRARGLMEHFHVELACTTDDPTDSLEHHRRLAADKSFPVRVLPAFRPDKALAVENPQAFNAWVKRLEAAAGLDIRDFTTFREALRRRHRAFHEQGCRLSDHGLEQPYAADCTEREAAGSFAALRSGRILDAGEALKLKSFLTFELAVMDAEAGWTQQFHFGALRNNNSRMFRALGPDSGYDAMGDFEIARPLARLLDRLETEGKLARTIIYVLNPRDNELVASLIGCFQDGTVAGKIQFGSAWWFNDQKQGMEAQLNALSNLGLLSRFVGMLTDSRSFLSYPRHEYFRRILCNLLGVEVEAGELPGDLALLGGIVQDVCCRNARSYLGLSG